MRSMPCREALLLIPGYLDGELSEEQAAPLRRHLLDCPGCREAAKDEKNLKAWFPEPVPARVPAGFAARVARLAFAPAPSRSGAGAEPVRTLRPARPVPALAGAPGVLAASPEASVEGRLLPFVLTLTAAAAAILLLFAIGIQSLQNPNTTSLRAEDQVPLPRAEVLRELEELNRAEAREAAAALDVALETPVDDGAAAEEARR